MKNVHKELLICLLAGMFVCAGCGSSHTAQLEQNKALIQRWFEVPSTENWAVLDELLSPDYVWHEGGKSESMTREETEQFLRIFTAAFDDIHNTIGDMIAEGDKVVARYTVRAIHKGEFLGTPPTGKEITYTGISICRISGDKIAEEWEEGDVYGFMQQLGEIPSDQ